jgi:hypothetical protein
MGTTPSPDKIAKLKKVSILGREETDRLVAEMVRITERFNTLAALPGDPERFAEILTSILSEENQSKVLMAMERRAAN